MRGQLPAPIVNGGKDSFWKWKDFQLSRARDLDLGSGHTAYRRASLIDLYLHAKFHWNQRNFWWTDRHLRPTLLGRLRRVDLKGGKPHEWRHNWLTYFHRRWCVVCTSCQKTHSVPETMIAAEMITLMMSCRLMIGSLALRGGCFKTSWSTGSTPRLHVNNITSTESLMVDRFNTKTTRQQYHLDRVLNGTTQWPVWWSFRG